MPPHPFKQARDGVAAAQIAHSPLEPKYLESRLPHNLPAKPQHSFPNSTWSGSPSTISKPQLSYAQGSMRTPEKPQHGSGAGQSATGRKDSVERSAQAGGRRPYASESCKTQRKTPKKQKGPPNDRKILKNGGPLDALNSSPRENTPTHSPVKKVSPTSAGSPTAESGNTNLVSSVALPVLCVQSKTNEGMLNSLTRNKSAQDFSRCGTDYTKVDSGTRNPDTRSNSVSSTSSIGLYCCSVLGRSSGPCTGTNAHTKTLSSDSVPAAATKVTTVVSFCVKGLPIDRKESAISTELVKHQKKKKSKNKKRSPDQSSRSNLEITTSSGTPQAPKHHSSNETLENSKVETRSHLKTGSNTTSSSATSTSTQLISANAVTAISPTQRPSNRKASVGRSAIGKTTPQEDSGRQLHRTSTQSKSSNGDDVFQDTKPALVKHTQDAKRLSQGKIEIDGSPTPSTGNSNSSPKNARSQDCEQSQTPTRKSQPRQCNNKSDPKAFVPNRKENKKPSSSPTEILSDPSNWPALGSTMLQTDTKAGSIQRATPTVKPLGERPLPPVPIRRDSMATVVSQPPQIVRRLT
jgi:hypothetical protein